MPGGYRRDPGRGALQLRLPELTGGIGLLAIAALLLLIVLSPAVRRKRQEAFVEA